MNNVLDLPYSWKKCVVLHEVQALCLLVSSLCKIVEEGSDLELSDDENDEDQPVIGEDGEEREE